MKKLFTLFVLVVLAMLVPRQAMAQEDDNITGYTKVNINVKTAVPGSGKVFPAAKETPGAKVWREEYNFKKAVAVGTYMGVNMAVFYIYAKPESSYTFGGWYLDDGDGVFDIETDEFIDVSETLYYTMILPDDTEVYSTEAAANSSEGPAEPTATVWAYFTKGAQVGMSHYQGDEYSHFAHCGTVVISKPVNEPGDEVTVRAIANDGFHFAFWQDADELGNIVSRDNPYTFTVQGGERLYAYFEADDAPKLTLPEEGGFAVLNTNHPWFLSDESVKNGAHVFVMIGDDLTYDAEGRAYLDTNVTVDGELVAQVDVAQLNQPTIVYGKGEVRFSIYLPNINFTRSYNNLVQWSGSKGVALSGDVIYVYIFVPELGAFIQYGTTDDYNPNATPTVQVPAGVAYFQMSAFDLTDSEGNIPTVIGFSPETYDAGMAAGPNALQAFLDEVARQLGIDCLTTGAATLRGQRVYTLSGLQVKTTPQKGVYIVNGKKIVIK